MPKCNIKCYRSSRKITENLGDLRFANDTKLEAQPVKEKNKLAIIERLENKSVEGIMTDD